MRNIQIKSLAIILVLSICGLMTEAMPVFTRAYSQSTHSVYSANNSAARVEAVKYVLIPSGQVAMKLSGSLNLFGTSTLHDWTMNARVLQGNAQFNIGSDGKLIGITALDFTLPVKNLKGDKDGLNDNAYEALKADQYKDIRFIMTSSKLQSTLGNVYTIYANGNLFIAGVTRPITMVVTARLNADGSVTCTGSQDLKMSEFKVERPSFMFGVMKTGDELKLSYSLVFTR